MDRDPSATIESTTTPGYGTTLGRAGQEIVDEDTSRVTYSAPRDSVDQGAHIASEEDTAMPAVSVTIFPAHTDFTAKIRTDLLETDDNNAMNLDLNTDTIFPDRVYLKRSKDPDIADARHNEFQEELESTETDPSICCMKESKEYQTENHSNSNFLQTQC